MNTDCTSKTKIKLSFCEKNKLKTGNKSTNSNLQQEGRISKTNAVLLISK